MDVHRLNNMVNPILPPTPVVEEEDHNVLIAEDDGMEVDTEAEPEEEVEPFEDDHDDDASDIDSDHSKA